ncbi:MAG: DUF1028 domain-containing protein [Verrucomicrobiota bacterium]
MLCCLALGAGRARAEEPPAISTFSIVAYDATNRQWGIAVQSKLVSVGAYVPWAEAGAGAIASQARANVGWGPEGLKLLAAGGSAEDTLRNLLEADPLREHRQIGIVDAKGRAAAHTGKKCFPWAGHQVGKNFCVQGNILESEKVIEAMAEAWTTSAGDFGQRLIAALAAGQDAGGDRRGRQAAALLIVKDKAGYDGGNDRYRDIRVDDHPTPIKELLRVYQLHRKIFR